MDEIIKENGDFTLTERMLVSVLRDYDSTDGALSLACTHVQQLQADMDTLRLNLETAEADAELFQEELKVATEHEKILMSKLAARDYELSCAQDEIARLKTALLHAGM